MTTKIPRPLPPSIPLSPLWR
uniref:Uncharacterized protein n=1 Tax=Arundo donax TaxID=35708 RepID=A0A0A9G4T6_ARUDO